MILESEPSLQRWLANQLKSIFDADPVALASYAIALLKHHDKKGDVLKKHCEEQLSDFLKENTASFIESLFRVLSDGSYKLDNPDDEDDVSYQFHVLTPSDGCISSDVVINLLLGRGWKI